MGDIKHLLSDLDAALLLSESSKTVSFDDYENDKAADELRLEEIGQMIAGMLMEACPADTDSKKLAVAIVESAVGASQDLGIPAATTLAAVIDYFESAVAQAKTLAEYYDENGELCESRQSDDEEGSEDEEDSEDEEESDDSEDEEEDEEEDSEDDDSEEDDEEEDAEDVDDEEMDDEDEDEDYEEDES